MRFRVIATAAVAAGLVLAPAVGASASTGRTIRTGRFAEVRAGWLGDLRLGFTVFVEPAGTKQLTLSLPR
jgi:hypothetical protein